MYWCNITKLFMENSSIAKANITKMVNKATVAKTVQFSNKLI